jgi:hypothetical protein
MPIRTWQIWNEANFFYFAFPVSVPRYAQALKLAHQRGQRGRSRRHRPAQRSLRRTGRGRPARHGRRRFPRSALPGAGGQGDFDAVALHPYAVDAETLGKWPKTSREVMLENHDPGAGLHVTEMGWGRRDNFQQVAFEQGTQGQVRQLATPTPTCSKTAVAST